MKRTSSRLRMLSIDTNIFLYALNRSCPEHEAAVTFLEANYSRTDVAIADYVLVELYMLLRNPAVLVKPLSGGKAAQVCLAYRQNPAWQVIEHETVMQSLWDRLVRGDGLGARRRIIDLRLGATLIAAGVTRFATRNVGDFDGVGFESVFDPIGEREK